MDAARPLDGVLAGRLDAADELLAICAELAAQIWSQNYSQGLRARLELLN